MVTEEFARKFADEWLRAWNSHDLDRILAHYRDEFEFASPLIAKIIPGGEGSLTGKKAVGEYWSQALQRVPGLKFELLSVYAGAGTVLITYQSVLDLPAAEWFEFDDQGLVIRAAAHYAGAV